MTCEVASEADRHRLHGGPSIDCYGGLMGTDYAAGVILEEEEDGSTHRVGYPHGVVAADEGEISSTSVAQPADGARWWCTVPPERVDRRLLRLTEAKSELASSIVRLLVSLANHVYPRLAITALPAAIVAPLDSMVSSVNTGLQIQPDSSSNGIGHCPADPLKPPTEAVPLQPGFGWYDQIISSLKGLIHHARMQTATQVSLPPPFTS